MKELISILGLVGLSFLIVESTLAIRIKKFFGLEPDNTYLQGLSNFKLWKKNFPKYYFLLFPICFLFKTIHLMTEILSCPACFSVWLTAIFCLVTGSSILYVGIVYLMTLFAMKYV